MTMRRSNALRPSGMTVLHTLYGLGVWVVCFVVLYGGLSIGCQTPLAQYSIGPFNGLTALLVALWLVHGGVLTVLVVRALRAVRSERRTVAMVAETAPEAGATAVSGTGTRAGLDDPPRRFMQRLALLLHTTALVATIAIGLPVLLLAPCV